MIIRAIAVWLILLLVAVANGIFRESVLAPRCGAGRAHVVSSAILGCAILALAWLTIPWIHPTPVNQAALVGAIWVALVLLFEFGLGHFVAGKPWSDLLADYNVFRGRVWVVIPILTAIAPYISARVRELV
jgi:hypothetical protein